MILNPDNIIDLKEGRDIFAIERELETARAETNAVFAELGVCHVA